MCKTHETFLNTAFFLKYISHCHCLKNVDGVEKINFPHKVCKIKMWKRKILWKTQSFLRLFIISVT